MGKSSVIRKGNVVVSAAWETSLAAFALRDAPAPGNRRVFSMRTGAWAKHGAPHAPIDPSGATN